MTKQNNNVNHKVYYSPPKKILEAVENYQEYQKEKKQKKEEQEKKEKQEKPKKKLNDGLKVWNQFIQEKRKEKGLSLTEALKMYGSNGSKHKEYQKYKQQQK